MDIKTQKLRHAESTTSFVGNPYGVDVYGAGNLAGTNVEVPSALRTSTGIEGILRNSNSLTAYREEVAQSRFFYRYDPIASTVINRMVDMAASKIKNRRNECTDEEIAYFNGVISMINPYISSMMLECLVTGMCVPDYGLNRMMGTRLNPLLGRRRYTVPDPFWLRNPDNIILKRIPVMQERAVYLRIPDDEAAFIRNKGTRPDGTRDPELYKIVTERFPEYVKLIEEGRNEIFLEGTMAITRKPMTNLDYPQPFLVPSLAALKHKWRIKQMDFSIASRAIEAIRHIKAGSDQFPVTEEDTDLEEIRQQLANRPGINNTQESIYTLYTNHTVTIDWIYPPLDALLSDTKYAEPNADILMGMGFSRVLLVGESLRSNSGGDTSTIGPISTLNELRSNILKWVKHLYRRLADENGFRSIPEPSFPAITNSDMYRLIEFAVSAVKIGAMSYDSLLQMFGSDFESENQQKQAEVSAGVPDPVPDAAPVQTDPSQLPANTPGGEAERE